MGLYRARDLLTVPSLLSLTRIPLAMLFPIFNSSPALAVTILAVAGLTDVVDGWYARRFACATATGAVVDGLTDKIFVLSVVTTLLWQDRLNLVQLCLLSSREIGELPLVLWWMFSRAQRQRKSSAPRANIPGKIATTLQFGAIALVTAHRSADVVILATAGAGIAAAISYWIREVSSYELARR